MSIIHLILGALLLSSFSLSLYAQNSGQPSSPANPMKKAIEAREELHRRLMDHLLHGTGKEDEIFQDMEALFEDVMSNLHDDFSSISGRVAKNYDMAWTESKDGRTLLISPQDKNQRLEFNIEKGMVVVRGHQESKTPNGTSTSSFNHIYSVPQDCDWSKVKMLEKNGKILMSFPYKSAAVQTIKKEKNERKPVAPSKEDIPI